MSPNSPKKVVHPSARILAHEFGALIQKHIDQKGWTHETVARRVWGSSGTSRRGHISGYIKGLRGKPSAATIRGFADALGISDEEIEVLRSKERTAERELAAELDVPIDLLNRIVNRFGEKEEFTYFVEFEDAIIEKASEYHRLRDEIKSLRAENFKLDNEIAVIDSLLNEGDVDGANYNLDKLLNSQLNIYIDNLKTLANLAIIKAEVEILRDDIESAFATFDSLLSFLENFSKNFAADVRNTVASRLLRYGLVSDPNYIRRSSELYRKNAEHYAEMKMSDHFVDAYFGFSEATSCFGIYALRNAATSSIATAAARLPEIVRVSDDAAEFFQHYDDQSGVAVSRLNLAGVFVEFSETVEDRNSLDTAISAYQQAVAALDPLSGADLWAFCRHKMGRALFTRGVRSTGQAGEADLRQALDAFYDALQVYEDQAYRMGEVTLQIEIGEAGVELASRVESPAEQVEHYVVAISACKAALASHLSGVEKFEYARARWSIGRALLGFSAAKDGARKIKILEEATHFLEEAIADLTGADQRYIYANVCADLSRAFRVLFVEGRTEAKDTANYFAHQAIVFFRENGMFDELKRANSLLIKD